MAALSLRLSIELFLILGLLTLLTARKPLRTRTRLALAAVLSAAALIRYLHTTTLGVLGRPFDLNADLPHLGNVLSMMMADLSPSIALAALLAPVAIVLLLFGTIDLCLRPLARLLQTTRRRAA